LAFTLVIVLTIVAAATATIAISAMENATMEGEMTYLLRRGAVI
jgi:hypothetical protein